MKIRPPWTNLEHAKLVRLASEGQTAREISLVINRTKEAIRARIWEYRLRSPNPVTPRAMQMVIAKTELISEYEVPDWYALGWRFVGFYGGRCKMEWTSAKPERKPVRMRVAA
jgi:hypothetical protein